MKLVKLKKKNSTIKMVSPTEVKTQKAHEKYLKRITRRKDTKAFNPMRRR